MLHKVIPNLSTAIKNDDVSFVVVVDNFNYKYVPFCIDYLSDKGFVMTVNEPIISMIPTETSFLS